jgi:nitrous oxidase accessory protein
MIRRISLGLILTLVLCWLFSMGISPHEVTASSNYSVHNRDTGLSYQTIQEAIDANETLDGHTILVDAGIYTVDHILVNKSVSLIGEDMDSTVIQATRAYSTFPFIPHSPTIFVGNPFLSGAVDNVTICAFTIRDGYQAIELRGNYAYIVNCTITNNTSGIWTVGAWDSTFGGNTIEGNIITDNVLDGISLETNNDTVYNNFITGNRGGIGLSSDLGTNNDTIYNNIIAGNDVGISLFNTSGVVIWGNTIENNQKGCQFAFASNTRIFYNNFLNNTVQVGSADQSTPIGQCDWDNGYPSGGNYWSNYNGTDADGDGIGDSPFIIDADNVDRYPLMMEYVIPEYPISLIFFLLMIATLLASSAWKKKTPRAPSVFTRNVGRGVEHNHIGDVSTISHTSRLFLFLIFAFLKSTRKTIARAPSMQVRKIDRLVKANINVENDRSTF